MKTSEINTRNAQYYWNLVKHNDEAPNAAAVAPDDDKGWWVDKMPVEPQSIEELRAKIADSERQFAMGNYITSEELFKKLDDKFHFRKPKFEMQLEEAV